MNRNQSVLLALLQKEDYIDKPLLIKWLLFLREEPPLRRLPDFYDFFSYEPFSFVLNRDLSFLERCGYLQVIGSRIFLKTRQALELPEELWQAIDRAYNKLKTGKEVVSWHTRPSSHNYTGEILTVGYEGKSIDGLLNLLFTHGVATVIDVRNNPISRKYGFSRRTLSYICKYVGLRYLSFPSLGIPSSYRSSVSSKQELWEIYENDLLPKAEVYQKRVIQILSNERGVLLCYEYDPLDCHRGILAKVLREKTGWEVRDLRKGAFL